MEQVEAFLNKLIQYGEVQGLFQKMPIKDISKSCCKSAMTEVYDFDECKKLVVKGLNIKDPKSCDALKIIRSKNTIDFIEFKGWQDFINNKEKHSGTDDTEKIDRQIGKHQFDVKISHSLLVLNNLILRQDFNVKKKENQIFNKVVKRFIVVVDIEEQSNNSLDLLAINLEVLATTSSSVRIESLIEEAMQKEVDYISEHYLTSSQSLILRTCTEIDAFYSES